MGEFFSSRTFKKVFLNRNGQPLTFFNRTVPAAIKPSIFNIRNDQFPNISSAISPGDQPYPSVSGDWKWLDLSILFSQRITGAIKIKIEIIIRSICNSVFLDHDLLGTKPIHCWIVYAEFYLNYWWFNDKQILMCSKNKSNVRVTHSKFSLLSHMYTWRPRRKFFLLLKNDLPFYIKWRQIVTCSTYQFQTWAIKTEH